MTLRIEQTRAVPNQLLPRELRRQVLNGIADKRLNLADIMRWVPNMDTVSLRHFLDTGTTHPDPRHHHVRMLVQLEHAWRMFERGQIVALSKAVGPDRIKTGSAHPYKHISDPNSPLFDIHKERKLAARRLSSMTRTETNLLGISQRAMQKIRHGEIPEFRVETLLHVLGQDRQKLRRQAERIRYGREEQPTDQNLANGYEPLEGDQGQDSLGI